MSITEIQRIEGELKALKTSNDRQLSIIKDLIEENQSLKGRESEEPYINCFFSMPFKDKYRPILKAAKRILEDKPYGWRVVRADTEHLAPTLSENIEKHIMSSHCFLAEISERNPNVFLEIGRMTFYKDRPLIFLCGKNEINQIPIDLSNRLHYSYEEELCDNTDLQKLVNELKFQFEKDIKLSKLRVQKEKQYYLSSELLTHYKVCSDDLANKITRIYKTVEEFLADTTLKVANKLNERERRKEILDVEYFLTDHFGIS